MAGIVDQIITGIKKLPGQLVGAPVDIANLISGAVTGRTQPIGSSEWINEKFGLNSKSSGVAEDTVSAVGGLLTPSGAAKGVAAGMVVPATLLKNLPLAKIAKEFKAGVDPVELWKKYGVFKNGSDDIIRAIIPDTNVAMKPGSAEYKLSDVQSRYDHGPEVVYKNSNQQPFKSLPLADQLDAPELFAVLPELKATKITPGLFSNKNTASYDSAPDLITINSASTSAVYDSMLVHEVNHAVQAKTGLPGGGASSNFYKDKDLFDKVHAKLKDLQFTPPPKNASPEYLKLHEANMDFLGDIGVTFDQMRQLSKTKYRQISGEADASLTELQRANNDYTTYPGTLLASDGVDLAKTIDPTEIQNHLVDQAVDYTKLVNMLNIK